MKKIMLSFFVFLCVKCNAQFVPNYYDNLKKYWWYRYTLVNDFMKIGDQCGESIPATGRFRRHAYYNYNNIFWNNSKDSGSLHWGDATQYLGKLLQKIEELTLYVIEQQKEIDELKKKIDK